MSATSESTLKIDPIKLERAVKIVDLALEIGSWRIGSTAYAKVVALIYDRLPPDSEQVTDLRRDELTSLALTHLSDETSSAHKPAP